MDPRDSYLSSPPILLFADSADALADHARRIAAFDGRLAGEAPIADALDRLDAAADVGAVVVDARTDSDALVRLLDRLDLAAREGRHASVVSVTAALIDLAAARAPHPAVAILADADKREQAAALAAALAFRRPVGGTVAESGRSRLQFLSEEVARIARTLAALSDSEEEGRRAAATGLPIDIEPPTAARIRAMIRARRLREQFFAADLFADPAWDILLDLAAARLEGQRVAVSSLCIAASVPATTALRWIKTLTDDGLLVRVADPLDGRRVFIDLSETAARGIAAYFQALARAGWASA